MNEAERLAEEQRKRAAVGNPMPVIPGQATGGVVPNFSVTTTQDPSSSTTQIKRDAGIVKAEQSIDEAKQARLDAVVAQAEVDKEAEQRAALTATAQAAALKAENDRLATAEEERKKRMAEIDAAEAQQQAIVDKAARPTGYFQDQSTVGRIVMALALGGAAAVGSEAPFKIYQNYQAEDRQRKMDILKAETAKLANITGSRERANEYFEREAARISREEIANGKIVAAQLQATAKKFPQSAAKAQQAVAEILQDTATKSLEHNKEMAAKVVSQSKQRSVSETTGEKAPAAPRQTTKEEEEAITSEMNAELFAKAKEIAKNNPAAVKELNDAIRASQESENLEKTGWGGVVRTLKGAGASPTSVDQRLKSADARLLYRAATMGGAMNAKSIDPSGALSDKTIDVGNTMIAPSSAPPEELAATFEQMQRKQEKLAAAKRRAIAPQQTQEQQAQPKGKITYTDEEMRALEFARNNPKNPKAREIVNRIKKAKGL